jgi:hypothetical protein
MFIFLYLFCKDKRSAAAVHEKGFNFDDARLMRGAWRNEPNPEACKVGSWRVHEISSTFLFYNYFWHLLF